MLTKRSRLSLQISPNVLIITLGKAKLANAKAWRKEADRMGIMEGVAAAGAIADSTVKVINMIRSLDTARSVILHVYNYTETELEIDWHKHDNGGWLINSTWVIPPQTSDTFSSRDTGQWTGTKGSVTYNVVGSDFDVQIRWDHPYYGDPNSSTSGNFPSTQLA
jgi:hypothetical protein